MVQSFGEGAQPYKYNGKEFVEMHGLNEYDSHARWYYPAIMRTTTMDPLAEKYYNISPYAWCGNNPISFIDLNGKDIKWESKKERKLYQRFEKKVNTRAKKYLSKVNMLNRKLQKSIKNRSAILNELQETQQKLGDYQQIQYELAKMKEPGTIFIIRLVSDEWGSTTQNPNNKEININISNKEEQTMMSLAHELCHGYQYLDGRLNFSEDGESGGDLYDRTDEKEAIMRQNLFDSELEDYSNDNINSLTEKQLDIHYPSLPTNPLPAPIDTRPETLIYNPETKDTLR